MKRSTAVILTAVLVLAFALNSFAATGITPPPTSSATGTLVMINPGVPYNTPMLALKTSVGYYLLTGNTSGMEKLIGSYVAITGKSYVGPQGLQFFNVVSYKVIKPAA